MRKHHLPRITKLALLICTAVCTVSCNKTPTPAAAPAAKPGELARIGSITITQADLDLQLKDKHSAANGDQATRQKALEELASRAQSAQAALDAGLADDPVVRAETARVLATRLRETTLSPKIKDLTTTISDERLRELYTAAGDRFRSNEKRQTAVLWLDPGNDPERKKQYEQKLATAREFLLANPDIRDKPAEGFSILSVDNTEHPASRYKGGIIGWLEREGGLDPWTKAVAEICFTLKEPGEASPVLIRPEGIFLVRYLAQTPAIQRPFETVREELQRLEIQRLRQELETTHDNALKTKYPIQWLTSPAGAEAPP